MNPPCQRLAMGILLVALGGCSGRQQFADLGDFRTESGEAIRDCRLGFRTYGRLDARRSNAVLVPASFLGSSRMPGWQIGPGGLVDSDRFFVIAVDPLGNGVSSSPSHGLQRFPALTIEDQVQAQFLLITGVIGLDHLAAVVGTSMGGMQALGWAALHPGFADAVVSIAGSPFSSELDRTYWTAAIERVRSRGNLRRAAVALEGGRLRDAVRELGISADDFESQASAVRSLDLPRHFGGSMDRMGQQLRGRVLLLVPEQDAVVDPRPSQALARASGATLVMLDGRCGHQASFCERGVIAARIRELLDARR